MAAGGFGKIILFGEHVVLYDQKAIIAALPHKTYAFIQPSESGEWKLIDQRPKVPTYYPNKSTPYMHMVRRIAETIGIDESLCVTLAGNLPVTSGGIGSSSAAAVAVTKAFNEYAQKHMTLEQINRCAFEGECCIHGTPSGIDNTAATYGGICMFQAGYRLPLNIVSPMYFVIADSGIASDTKIVISALQNFFARDAYNKQKILAQYKEIISASEQALQQEDLAVIGLLMNKNHALLQDMGISSESLDNMVTIARHAGALGAKMTGTGRGGIVIALAKDVRQQYHIEQCFMHDGFWTLSVCLDYSATAQK